jgi:tetratricopeptide (TPR) repeat protein
MRHSMLLVCTLALVAGLADPAIADDRATCEGMWEKAPDAAIAACGRLIASGKDRNLASTYRGRGLAYRMKDEYDRALADLSEAIRLNPQIAAAYSDRGLVYNRKGEYDRAIGDLNEAIRLNPKLVAAYSNRGLSYNYKGDYDSAFADLNEAIRLDPKYAAAYNNRGLAYKNKGEYERAIADLNEAIALQPNATSYRNRALAQGGKGDYGRALTDLNEAIRLNPKYAAAYSDRGFVYEKKGDYDRAIADLNEAIRLDPTHAKRPRERLAVLEEARARPSGGSQSSAVATTRPSAEPMRRIALVIGNSSYGNVPPLANARRDADAVATALRKANFQSVMLENDLARDKLINVLRDFAAEAEKADWAVVYFAGHGIEIGGVNYLIPVDARLSSDRDVSFEGVPLDQVMNAAEGAKKLRMVLLDACRDNPFVSQMRRSAASRSITRGLGRIEPEAGTLVVYAAKHGELALDGDEYHSPFVSAFVKRVATPGLEVRRLFDYVRDDVLAATKRRQQPFSYGSLPASEDFFFVQR